MLAVKSAEPINPVVNQLKSLLEGLPVSKAAVKKAAIPTNDYSNANTFIKVKPKGLTDSQEKDDNSSKGSDYDTPKESVEISGSEEKDQEVPRCIKSRISCSQSPISFLLERSQKTQNISPPIWDEFSNYGLFGCKVSVGNKFWIASATYSRKKEARTMAALMACTELFGNCLLYENIELHKYESWTKESVRKVSDELALTDYNNTSQDIGVNGFLGLTKSASQSQTQSVPLESSGRPQSTNTSYVSLLNETYQQLQKPLPVYNIYTEKCGSANRFRCCITNSEGLPDVRTDAMQSIRAAKNEAARQMCELMQTEFNIIKPVNNIPKPAVSHDDSSKEIISLIKNVFNIAPEAPIDPVTLIPLVMALLAHVSRACYPEKSSIDGIYELVDQWKFFLEWKERNI